MKRFALGALILLMAYALCACSASQDKLASADLARVMKDIEEKGALPDTMIALSESDLLDLYGIEGADVKQFAAQVNSDGLACDEIVLVEAVDQQAAKRVQEKLAARYEAKLNENRDYLPEQYEIIKKCSVTTRGNTVAMIVSADAANMIEIYDAAFQ